MPAEANPDAAGLSRLLHGARCLVAAAGVAIVAACFAPAVLAQDGPRDLFPQGNSGQSERSTPREGTRQDSWSLPDSDQGTRSPDSWQAPSGTERRDRVIPDDGDGTADGRTRLRGGILVDELEDSFPETLGPLAAGDGGLGLDLWRGSQRGEIIRLLNSQPRPSSPVARGLLRRLLLSSAQPPAADGRRDGQPDLLIERARLLLALGEYENLVNLLVQIPGLERSSELARLQVEAALLAQEPDAVCPMVRRALSLHRSREFWPKAQIYCQIRNGEDSAASIGIGLQREVGNSDTTFLNLADAALGVGEVPRISGPSALDLALLRQMQAGSALVSDGLSADFMAAAVTLPGLEAERRVDLAEEAARRGVLPLRLLGEAYGALSFTDSDLRNATGRAAELDGGEARALLYQAMRRANAPEARGEALRALLESAAEAGLEPQVTQIVQPVLERIGPEPALSWLAPTAVRAALLAGRFEMANAWVQLLQRNGNTAEARGELASLWPLFRLAGMEEPEVGMTATDWAERRVSRGAGREETRSLQRLYESLQASVSGAAGLDTASAQLRRAVREDRRGEGILLSLRTLDQGQGSARGRGDALTALSQLGFSREARLLAMHALVGRGL
ncbi:hypothetical protein ACFOW6_03080 [Fodinicurvata halophila]|uniref:Uncharacterized protein n=1 Tax=Fodinicurvata halophila TaxID=1419723 RepID=A0ABV8UJ67_9PROT